MKIIHSYQKLIPYIILRRLNRFSVLVNDSKGEEHLAHLTNTGRLLDLVVPGNACLCISKKPAKTTIRLIGVRFWANYGTAATGAAAKHRPTIIGALSKRPYSFNPKPEAMVVCWWGRCALATAIASGFGLNEYS